MNNPLKEFLMKTSLIPKNDRGRGKSASVLKLVAFLLFVLLTNNVFAAVIQFKSTASVSGSVIYLKDIANVMAANEKELNYYQNIMIAPAPGNESQIAFDTVRSRMAAMGIDLSRIEFKGSSLIHVTKQGQVKKGKHQNFLRINPAQVKRAEKNVSDAIKKVINLKEPQAGYFSVDVQLNPQDVADILRGAIPGYQVAGWNTQTDQVQEVTISYQDPESKEHQFRVACQIIPHPYVVITNYAISRGQVLRQSDFTFRQLEKYDPEDQESYFTQIEDVAGAEANRSMQKGNIVSRKDIREIPLVRANDVVDVVARRGKIRITTKMKAKQDGVKGEFITLKSFDGKKTLIARVVGLRATEIGNGNSAPSKQNSLNNSIGNQTVRISGHQRNQQNYNRFKQRSRQTVIPVNGNRIQNGSRVRTGDYSIPR